MSDVNISTESLKRVNLVTAAGRIDSETAPELDKALKESYQHGRHNIVIELSGVSYMSSAGLRALVAANRECKKKGGDVRLAAPSDRVAEVLSLAGLVAGQDSFFQLFDDSTSAVGSF